MGEYFTTRVSGIDEDEVKRRVDELVAKGFEVVAEHEESWSVARYKRRDSLGRSKFSFAEREERGKFIVVMRRLNAKQARAHV